MIYILPKKCSKTSPRRNNMESERRRIQREPKKRVDSVLLNNIAFYWKVALLKIITSDDNLKENSDIINVK